MMLGHALLAFALVALGCRALGWSPERALRAGTVAGAFAVVPDVDMVYAVTGLIGADPSSVFVATNAFWGASTEVHRTATHSVVVAVPAAVGFGLRAVEDRLATAASAVLLSGIALVTLAVTGLLEAFVLVVFCVAGLGVATAATRSGGLSPGTVLGTALVGLVTHPFGDMFTGSAPALLYPLDVRVVDGIVVLHSDPTLHLLGAFAIELATVWLAGAVYIASTDTTIREAVDHRAALGICYGLAAFVIPPPTLDVSYHFVFSVLAVGLVLTVPELRNVRAGTIVGGSPYHAETDGGVDEGSDGSTATVRRWARRRNAALAALLTGTAAVTAAWAAYLVAYLAA
ncbi:hypothetical protein BRD00_04980 [Halobacteriales archaeon QS_8_69_26]|nr:MAG: hypothetical protein BRD00_04980 [Halobacteriales archaeon QS_8_69_26]